MLKNIVCLRSLFFCCIVLTLFLMLSGVVSARWESSKFGSSIIVDEPIIVNWESAGFGSSVTVDEPIIVNWEFSKFGSSINVEFIPVLTNPLCTPAVGIDSYTTFFFNVTLEIIYESLDGYLNVNISKDGWSTNQSMNWVSGDNTTGAIYSYSTTLTAGSYNYIFYVYDGTNKNSSGPHNNPSVSSQSYSFNLVTSSNGNLDFKDWTLLLTGVGLTTQYNVSEDNQTADIPALNITNTGNVPLNFSINWSNDPGSGISMKYNTSFNSPDHGVNTIDVSPQKTWFINNLDVDNYSNIWLWMDFVSVHGQTNSEDITITSCLYEE